MPYLIYYSGKKSVRLIFFTIKELIEYAIVYFRRLGMLKGEEAITIESEGIFVRPNFLSQKHCRELCSRLDELIDSGKCNVWEDEVGADKRIYFAETLDEEFKNFYENDYIRSVFREYTGIANPHGLLLAARIDAVEGNNGSGGGWHRDSPISRQFKAIVYLNDVDEAQGPFQYVRKSHGKVSSIWACWKRIFKPGHFRFEEVDVNRYIEASGQSADLIVGDAGSLVLVDTKGIHRGYPIKQGRRYALFCYFWEREIPNHFSEYRQ